MSADVSNAAVGGEVLLDEPTFLQIKEDLWRLGLISGAGLDYDLLHAGRGSNKESDHVRSAGKRMLDRMKLRWVHRLAVVQIRTMPAVCR